MATTREAVKAMYDAFCSFLVDRAIAEGDLIPYDDEDAPVLFEDEIAEILEAHKGEEIQIHDHPESALRFRYHCYEHDKGIVFTVYDAIENHCLVTVGGTNIVDL